QHAADGQIIVELLLLSPGKTAGSGLGRQAVSPIQIGLRQAQPENCPGLIWWQRSCLWLNRPSPNGHCRFLSNRCAHAWLLHQPPSSIKAGKSCESCELAVLAVDLAAKSRRIALLWQYRPSARS